MIVMQRNTVMVQKAELELRQLGQYSLDELVIAADWTANDAAQWWQRFSNTEILPQSGRSSPLAAVRSQQWQRRSSQTALIPDSDQTLA